MATVVVPFDPPTLQKVRRITGYVDVPEENDPIFEHDIVSTIHGDADRSSRNSDSLRGDAEGATSVVQPRILQRSQSMTGKILLFESHDGEPVQAFWLQRKLGNKMGGGIVRLGYRLYKQNQSPWNDSEVWKLDVDQGGKPLYVRVVMVPISVLEHGTGHSDANELCALQLIAEHSNGVESHVMGTNLLGADDTHIYAVVPHYRDGTLLQYTLSQGTLEEPHARFFFQQILQVRKRYAVHSKWLAISGIIWTN
jgi:hypothetical protein